MKWIFKAGTVFYFLTVSFTQPPEFNYNYSPLSAIVLGQASIEETPASNPDWIAAFDPDGVCAGSSNIFETDNRSNFVLQIYGDDLSTENLDEGLFEGDYFTFSFFEFSSNTIIHDTTKYYGWENRNGGWLNLSQNDSLLTLINNLKLNQLQVVGSHNSYHIAPYDTLFGIINAFAPELALSIDYTHLVLPQQFLNYGIRQIELDVYRDPEGGLFSSRLGNWLAGQDVTPDIPELSESGLKILHFPDIDFDTHLITFKNGLEKLKIWSDIFPGHVPIFVLIECKSDGLEDYFDDYPQLENLIALLPDSITYTVPLPFNLTGLEEAEAEIREVFGDSLENIITPDMVRGDFPTLEDAILSGGWPTVGEVRGKIMFGLDNQGSLMDDYMEGYPSLSGRILFTEAPPGTPEAAFLGMNTPSPEITERVNQGYLVRTRADTDTEQARTGDTSRRDEALASGAHFVSTDYYSPDPRHELDPGWTNYSVRLPGEFFSRVNPVNGPPELSGNDLGLINFDMNINFFLEEPICDEGFIEIGDDCYWEDDIGVLQQFIDNSPQTINMNMDGNGNGVIEPLELGYIQQWETGRLIELDCGYPVFCGLSGEIPEEIGNMEFLESIRIYVNYLSGPIPESIGSLANLSVLDLNNNLLSGTIPESICDIQPNLDILSLDFNHLCPPYPECVNEDVGFQDTSQCVSIWHVSTSGSDSNSGSEEFPFATIQHGIDISSNGDSVFVSSGTYFENIDYSGKNIAILGEDRESTIIDGNQSGSVVTFDSIVGSTAVLSDFTITGGNAYDGGGIYCTSSSPTIRDNIITGNVSETYGGGISCNYSSAVIVDNTITANSAYYGGGISFDRYTSSVIKGNNISGNSAVQGGGISCTVFSSPSIINNTISGNSAFTNGGGVYCYYVSSPTVTNTIIWENTASTDQNISVYSADPIFNYCDVQGNWEGIGNIDSDPFFVAPDSGDFHLQANSPCIDTGDPNSPLDPDSTIADMGAYYFYQSPCDSGFVEIEGICFNNDDIAVLQKFIDNSYESGIDLECEDWDYYCGSPNPYMDSADAWFWNVVDGQEYNFADGDGIVEPLELGIQEWENGRLTSIMCGAYIYCQLSGPIPENISELTEIEQLRLEYNYLSDYIPEEMCGFDLNYGDNLSFDITGNYLCPPYPECIEEYVSYQDTTSCELPYTGSTWYVSTLGSDSNNGSEEFPFATIQFAVDVSSDGDTVLVYPGTFYGAIDFLGKSIVLGSMYILEQNESYIDETFLSNFVNISLVSDSELNGFTFQDIYLNSEDGPQAIIYIEDASPKIINNRFDNFYLFQDVESAVIYCENSSSIIMNNVFTNGSVGNGYVLAGYILSKNSNLTIKNNQIENGYIGFAEPSGYIVSVNSEDIIESNIIINTSMGYCWVCAAISILDGSNCIIRNNLIAQAYGDGYGAVVASESQFVSNNNTFVSNSVGYANLSSDGTVSNDIIFGTSNPVYVDENSSIEVTYSDIEGGWAGEGNIDANPLFVSPDNSDYHLQSDSPCIDAGDPNFPNDPDDTIIDMGAYYYNQTIEFPKNIIGYYTSWSVYARDYHVSDIPSEKINFINYAFANINSVTGTIMLGDPYADIDKFYPGDCWEEGCLRGSFHQLQLLKADYPNVKTLISVGGWTWSTYFSDVAMTEESREIFAQSCVDFILEYDFDGIDLDWEYPVEGGLGGNNHHPDDGVHLTLLLQKIRQMLNEQEVITGRTYYLTIAASANPIMMDNLEVEAISEVLDWINIMSYDFHGPWSGEGDPVTNFNSPLYSVGEDPTPEPYHSEFNLSSSVQNFIDRGVPKDKLNAGLAFYGRAFGGVSGGENGLFAPYTGPAGEGTWENGVFDYWDLDIDYIDMNGYSKYWHDGAKVPWLFNSSTQIMVSYDDEESILLKTQYINDENIGGAMFWEFSSDKNGDLLNIVHETIMNGDPSETEEIDVSYNGNWNLLSVPDESVDFPCTNYIDGTLYSFEYNSYTNVGVDDITVGQGYWLRFEDMVECTFSGDPITETSVQLTEGWNLMGSISSSVDVASIIDEDNLIVPSTIYGFDESYTEAEMIEPGYGYWLRAFQDGEITLTSDVTARAVPLNFSLIGQANSLTVNGMDLYFGLELSTKDRLSYSLPPKPPAGAFDIRFNGDWKLVKDYGELEVKSPHESLSISYDILIEAGEHMNWVLTSDNGKNYILEEAGEITVPSAERFILSRKPVIPVTFALHQNFPNPFNPITTLRYDLPEDNFVTLSIYDMLGRQVILLVNTTQEAGFKSIKWDARNRIGKQVSAGVYLYRIEAGEFVKTKKMVLLK